MPAPTAFRISAFKHSINIYDNAIVHFVESIDLLITALTLMVDCGKDAGAPMPDITNEIALLRKAQTAFSRPLQPKEPTDV